MAQYLQEENRMKVGKKRFSLNNTEQFKSL